MIYKPGLIVKEYLIPETDPGFVRLEVHTLYHLGVPALRKEDTNL